MRDSLPVHGVNFILGNDIAGGKIFPLLEVCDKPVLSDNTDELLENFHEFFSVCAVIRAQARKFADADDLSSTFMVPMVGNDVLLAEIGKPDDKIIVLKPNDLELQVTSGKIITAQKDDFLCKSVFPLSFLWKRHGRGEMLTICRMGC